MSIDLYFSNTALYQDSVKVFRERSCCSKERNVNLTKIQNQLLYMFDAVKKNYFVSLLSNYCFITIIMGIRLVDFRNQFPFMTWQRYRLKSAENFCWFNSSSLVTSLHYYLFLSVFFFVFSSRTDSFFNLSCHLFSYPFCLKKLSLSQKSFSFSPKIRRGEKIICSCFKSLQVKTNFGLHL